MNSRTKNVSSFVGLLAICAIVAITNAEESKEPEEDLLASQPQFVEGSYFLETFTDPIEGRWIKSSNSVYNGNAALKQQAAKGTQGIPGDAGLVLSSESKRYGVSAPFTTATVPGKELVVQYELKLNSAIDCAGAYLKLLEGSPKLEDLEEKTSYTIMFGPDKCGTGTNKVHLILRFKNEKSGEYKEHHLKAPPSVKNDQLPHLYTMVLRPDNSFEMFIDQESVKSGSLTSENDWETPFNIPKEIDDPEDKKPSDWVDEEKIKDPEAKKPEDWDEDAPKQIEDMEAQKPSGWDEDAKEKIPDPAAKKPDDWDEDEDGPWEAPLVENPKCKEGCGPWKRPMKANPAYKGKWTHPMITNPAYKGIWKPKRIDNPAYYEVTDPVAKLAPIGAVAIEVWVHKPEGILFDNILVGDNYANAKDFGTATWKVRVDREKKKNKDADLKAKAEARKKKLETGGTWVQVEEYTKMAAEAFAAYPWISFPVMLLFFFLIFKFCRGEKDSGYEPPRRAAKRAGVSAKTEAKADAAEDESADAKGSSKDGGDLRQRKGTKEEAAAVPEEAAEETDKDK